MIGIFGNMSSGKTLTAVKIIFSDYKHKKIISNIVLGTQYFYQSDIDFLNWYVTMIQIQDKKEQEEFIKERFEDTVWLIDEIGKVVPSRKRTFSSEIFTDFITMVGKLNCKVIYTSQLYESQVDKIFRELTPVIIDCKRCNQYGQPIFTDKRYLDHPILIRCDFTLKVNPIETFTLYYNPSQYFKYYNSKEFIFLNRAEVKKMEKKLR